MDTQSEAYRWAESEFGHAAIPDARNVARLVQMAERPLPRSPRYFSAGTAAELAGEFASVTSSLVDVRLDGASLVHDVGRRDGWDWADDAHREIHFYGATCDLARAATGGSRLVASFGCPAPVPP